MVKKCLFIFVCFLIVSCSFAAEEIVIKSRSGKTGKPIVTTAPGLALSVADQWYSYMLQNPLTYGNKFAVSKAGARVSLRWDDADKTKFDKPWSCTVKYALRQYNASGAYQDFPGQELTIYYNPSDNATHCQKSVNTYFHTQGAAQTPYKGFRSELIINDVIYCSDNSSAASCSASSSNSLPTALNDIYLDLEQVTERYYALDIQSTTAAPGIKYEDGFNPQNPATNELKLSWNYIQGAESYDLEWVFIDATDFDASNNLVDLKNINRNYSFSDATRINTHFTNYAIPLIYPRGVLIYRVRAVGNYSTQTAVGTTVVGQWSYDPANPNTALIAMDEKYRFDITGHNTTLNWQYSAVFAEDGKRKELISYFDGSLHNRQTVTVLNTTQDAIIAETKYDFEGRPAVQFLPTPLSGTGVLYKGIDFYKNFNANYNRNNFDLDNNVANPDPVLPNNLSSQYYSQRPNASGIEAFIPDAQGFPYTRTRFKTDGTGRIRSQGGVGIDHKLGSQHEVKYLYGTASEDELDRLFGNEVGYVKHYQKNMVKDANGQVSVSYLDQEGRTIATAICGNGTGTPLLPVDNAPAGKKEKFNILKNTVISNNHIVSVHTETVSSVGPYQFTYKLDEASFNAKCFAGTGLSPKLCKYDLEISITDEDGIELAIPTISTSSPCTIQQGDKKITCKKLSAANYDFTLSLPFGSYTIKKVLSINQETVEAYKKDFIDAQNKNHYCVPVPPIVPEVCTNDCNTACYEQYIIRDEITGEPLKENGEIVYYNPATGQPFQPNKTKAEIDALVLSCANACGAPPVKSPCQINLEILTADMSPGGQYFDNAGFKYRYDTNGNLELNPDYNRNDWLVNLGVTGTYIMNDIIVLNNSLINPNSAIKAITLSNTSSNWEIIKNNWNQSFNSTMKYWHPEYPTFVNNCELQYCAITPPYPTSHQYINTGVYPLLGDRTSLYWSNYNYSPGFDNTIDNAKAELMGYFNPFNFKLNTTTKPNGDNSDYCNYSPNLSTSGYINLDPYFFLSNESGGVFEICPDKIFKCPGGTDLSRLEVMSNYLKKYYQVPNTNNFYSIWFVIEDPLNFHLPSTPNVPAAVRTFFQSLHGDGTAANPAVIGIGPNQITKYQFFCKTYNFLKGLVVYKASQAIQNPVVYLNNAGNGYTALNGSVSPYVVNGVNLYGNSTFPPYYQIRYPKNEIYESITNMCEGNLAALIPQITTTTDNTLAKTCLDACTGYADEWLSKVAFVHNLSSLSATKLAELKNNLIQVCAGNCNNNNPEGTNGAANSPLCSTCVPANQFKTFTDVIDYYFPANKGKVNITHPETDNGSCTCKNLNDFIEMHYTAPYTFTYNGLATDINTELNLSGASAVNATQVQTWMNTCNLSLVKTYNAGSGLLSSYSTPLNTALNSMPTDLFCPEEMVVEEYNPASCSCKNLNYFINAFNLDPTTDKEIILADLNSALGTSTTLADLDLWFNECDKTKPSQAILKGAGFPIKFTCAEALSTSDEDIAKAMETSACLQENLNLAIEASAKGYEDSLKTALADFVNQYKNYCNTSVSKRESFTMEFDLQQFLYTLYYYDQAGTLIRTVPPEGVKELSTTDVKMVQDHREDPTKPAVYPEHTLVSNYKFNSLQQLTEQNTPDGGKTIFFYDALGRLVVSQNDNQRVNKSNSNPSNVLPYKNFSNVSYSYTIYDELGRTIEVGEGVNPTINMSDEIARNKFPSISLQNWLAALAPNKRQVTKTIYGEPLNNTINALFTNGQQNLRNRVASVLYYEDYSKTTNAYTNASHYSYDIHGNVNSLVQENNESNLPQTSEKIKTIDYEYDLVSGNVNAVHYQMNKPDQFHHQYNYDADNRLTEVFTSNNNVIWNKEAKNFYYPHGPLARTELANNKVIGTDYAYTIHGWIKGVNSNTLNSSRDIGKDGNAAVANINTRFAKDAFGYSLGYYNADYKAIGKTAPFEATVDANTPMASTTLGGSRYDLYNGNISMMVSALQNTSQQAIEVQGRLFRYDQLNRIKQADAYTDANLYNANSWTSSATTNNNNYQESFSYDFNGNLKTLKRFGNIGLMDELEYYYSPKVNNVVDNKLNRLVGVKDKMVLNALYTDDIDDQNVNINNPNTYNYVYDNIGNLIQDNKEEIASIEWTVYGKIKEIKRTASSTKRNLEFIYDATGNRIVKIVKPNNDNNAAHYNYTYYVRDAQGNVMASYNKIYDAQASTSNYSLAEQHLYGSSRLGVYNANLNLNPTTSYPANPVSFKDILGLRNYELSNHLGNVLSVVTDRKLPYQSKSTFDNNDLDNWKENGGNRASLSIVNNQLKVTALTASGSWPGTLRYYPTVAGKMYAFSCDIDEGNCQYVHIVVWEAGAQKAAQINNPNVKHPVCFMGTGADVLIEMNAGVNNVGSYFTIDNAELKEIVSTNALYTQNFNQAGQNNVDGWSAEGTATISNNNQSLSVKLLQKDLDAATYTFNTQVGHTYLFNCRMKFDLGNGNITPNLLCHVFDGTTLYTHSYFQDDASEKSFTFTAKSAQTKLKFLVAGWNTQSGPFEFAIDDINLSDVTSSADLQNDGWIAQSASNINNTGTKLKVDITAAWGLIKKEYNTIPGQTYSFSANFEQGSMAYPSCSAYDILTGKRLRTEFKLPGQEQILSFVAIGTSTVMFFQHGSPGTFFLNHTELKPLPAGNTIYKQDFNSGTLDGWNNDPGATVALLNQQVQVYVPASNGSGVAKTFATTMGNTYKLNFDINFNGVKEILAVVIDMAGNIPLKHSYFENNGTENSFLFTAKSNQTQIKFIPLSWAGQQGPYTYYLDNILLQDVSGAIDYGYKGWNNPIAKATTVDEGTRLKVDMPVPAASWGGLSRVYNTIKGERYLFSANINDNGYPNLYPHIVAYDGATGMRLSTQIHYMGEEEVFGFKAESNSVVIQITCSGTNGTFYLNHTDLKKVNSLNNIYKQNFNNTFTSDDWSTDGGASKTIVNGKLQVTLNAKDADGVYKTFPTVIGRTYKLKYDIDLNGLSVIKSAVLENGNYLSSNNIYSGANSEKFYTFVATNSSVTYRFYFPGWAVGTAPFVFNLDNFVLEEVNAFASENYTADVQNTTDYYAFGNPMPGRQFNPNKYRYGYNGKELDIDGMGGGQSTYDYGFRIYNPAIGRFLSVDPLTKSYPWYTPYQFAGNKPIENLDLDGLEEYHYTEFQEDKEGGGFVKIVACTGVLYKRENPITHEIEEIKGTTFILHRGLFDQQFTFTSYEELMANADNPPFANFSNKLEYYLANKDKLDPKQGADGTDWKEIAKTLNNNAKYKPSNSEKYKPSVPLNSNFEQDGYVDNLVKNPNFDTGRPNWMPYEPAPNPELKNDNHIVLPLKIPKKVSPLILPLKKIETDNTNVVIPFVFPSSLPSSTKKGATTTKT